MVLTVKIIPGDRVTLSSGIYHIESEIGSGGFGTVFKAFKDDNNYAIKLNRIWELLPDDRDEVKRRIKQEYEISSSIHSKHIVHSYGYDEIHGNPILIMDYCPDGSLRKKIGETFTNDSLKKILFQLLNALNILHSYNIIHRDIKPENILFKGDTALLTDFGISANLKNRVTQINIRGAALRIFATLSYSPPEQSQKNISFKMTGPTNDIFSVGVILYEMITMGKLPFGDIIDFKKDSEVVERRKIQGKWNKSTLKKYTNNKIWFEVIEHCLYPDPGMRYQSINEIFQILRTDLPELNKKDKIWKLIINEGPEIGKEFNITELSLNLNKRVLTIGRFDEGNNLINDIAVEEGSSSYLSLHHGTLECIIKNDVYFWYIRDGQWYNKYGKKGWYLSKNGIKVNNARINEIGVDLKDNDQICIGKISLKVCCF